MVKLLIPIILIEGFIYKRHLNRELIHIGKAASAANVFTTFIGYPLSWFLLLILQYPLVILSAAIAKATGTSSTWFHLFAPVLMPAWFAPFNWVQEWMLPVAAIVGLIPAYFVSVEFETWILTKFFFDESKERLKSLCHRANQVSYLLLFMFFVCSYMWIVHISE